jgi:hypothetical protein
MVRAGAQRCWRLGSLGAVPCPGGRAEPRFSGADWGEGGRGGHGAVEITRGPPFPVPGYRCPQGSGCGSWSGKWHIPASHIPHDALMRCGRLGALASHRTPQLARPGSLGPGWSKREFLSLMRGASCARWAPPAAPSRHRNGTLPRCALCCAPLLGLGPATLGRRGSWALGCCGAVHASYQSVAGCDGGGIQQRGQHSTVASARLRSCTAPDGLLVAFSTLGSSSSGSVRTVQRVVQQCCCPRPPPLPGDETH